jgi:hypothetical protein
MFACNFHFMATSWDKQESRLQDYSVVQLGIYYGWMMPVDVVDAPVGATDRCLDLIGFS